MACIALPVSAPPQAADEDADSSGSAHGAPLPPPPPPFPPPPTALPSALSPGGGCVHAAESSGDSQHSLGGDQAVGAGCPATEYGGAPAAGPPEAVPGSCLSAPPQSAVGRLLETQLALRREVVKEAALGGAAGAPQLADDAEYGHGGGGQRSAAQSVSNARQMPYNDAYRLDVVLEGACTQKPRPHTLQNPKQGWASLKLTTYNLQS
jgi:hypothetical protein